MEERKASFDAINQPVYVHCGFLAPSAWDKVRLQTSKMDCEVVVATAVLGAQDRLFEPCPETRSEKKICYVAFVDAVTKHW